MKKFLFSWWTLTIFTAVLVAVILALVLPMFVHFLRPWWVRLLVVLLVVAVWGTFALLRVMKARKASDEIAKELAKPDEGDAEAQALSKRMADALAGLRQASGGKRDYLYSRPWYLIIGPPGAGKTTALLNSGLRFPFSDAALKGVGDRVGVLGGVAAGGVYQRRLVGEPEVEVSGAADTLQRRVREREP